MQKWAVLCFFVLVLWSCEKPFVPDNAELEPQLVVEGYIEAGERARPPYLLLTRSVPFFTEFNAEDFNANFVSGAEIRVSDGEDTVALQEVCLDELDAQQKQLAAAFLGLPLDSIGFNICLYTDLTFSMLGEEGKTYELWIEAEGQEVYAATSIPPHVPVNEFDFREVPGEPVDTLARLIGLISDPGGEANFYRYQMGINGGPIVSPAASVVDDRLFDGQTFEFPLFRPEPRGNPDLDIETFGLYTVGDTVEVKWINIDKAQYDFWNTLEFNTANQGPFSSYTLVESNVVGGLGLWGGLSASYYNLVVEK
ncbi:MAG: DUF4249 family protein [Bacteroidetes bacterium]|jgi:hypothetical protein|nr:DUF4249 family protein [Bacteroidota bacterium]